MKSFSLALFLGIICVLQILEIASALKCYQCGYLLQPDKCPDKDDPNLLVECTEQIDKDTQSYTCGRYNQCYKGVCNFNRKCNFRDNDTDLSCNAAECECNTDGCNGIALDKIADPNGKSGSSTLGIITPFKYSLYLLIGYFGLGVKIYSEFQS